MEMWILGISIFSETYFSHLRPDRRLIDIRFFCFVRPPPPPRRSNRLTIKYFVMINRIGWKFLNCERTRTSARRIVKFFIHSCFTLFLKCSCEIPSFQLVQCAHACCVSIDSRSVSSQWFFALENAEISPSRRSWAARRDIVEKKAKRHSTLRLDTMIHLLTHSLHYWLWCASE